MNKLPSSPRKLSARLLRNNDALRKFAARKWLLRAMLAQLAIFASTGARSESLYTSQLEPFIEQTMAHDAVTGIAVGVVAHGKLIYAHGFGVSRLDGNRDAVTPKTLFHTASITKTFVATAVMQLIEAGKLSLSTAVTARLPYFIPNDEHASRIRIAQLLDHTSGLTDVEDYGWDRPEFDARALERYVRGLTGSDVINLPGKRFFYSNMGFEVLGDVVAKVSGKSIEDYVTESILWPLHMNASSLYLQRPDGNHVAFGFTRASDGRVIQITAYPYNRAHTPSSNLQSNLEDLAQWLLLNLAGGTLNGNRILSASSQQSMWQPRVPAGVEGHAGYGWFLTEADGEHLVGHSGSDDGFHANIILDPKRDLGIIYFSNCDYDPRDRISRAILRTALGRPLDLQSLPAG